MSFDLAVWQEKLKDQFKDFKNRMQQAGIQSIYTFISVSALWPLLAEVSKNNLAALAPLFTVLAPLGSNLMANQIQRLKDYTDRKKVAQNLEQAIASEPALQKELDTILEKLDALRTAQAMLKESEREWFVTTLEKELRKIGNWEKYKAVLRGDSNVLAQGEQATAVGPIQADQGTVVVAAPGAKVQINQESSKRDNMAARDQKSYRQKYLERLYRSCLTLPLATLGGEEGIAEEVTLDQVYIALNTTTAAVADEKEFRNRARQKKEELLQELLEAYKKGDREKYFQIQPLYDQEDKVPLLPALDALNQTRKMVLLGDPGAGKSTFVKRMAAALAAKQLNLPGKIPDLKLNLFPVLLTLREWVPRLAALDLASLSNERQQTLLVQTLYEQIEQDLKAMGVAEFSREMRDILDSGDCFLIFDGLDEVPFQYRTLVRQSVSAVIKTCRLKQVVITSRIRSYTGSAVFPNFTTFTLSPFDEQQIRNFIQGWYQTQQKLGRLKQNQTDEKVEDLTRAALKPELRELAENPMLLTTMALVHQQNIGLPDQRVELYNLAVDILLRRWQKHKLGEKKLTASPALTAFLNDSLRLRKTIEHLAYEAHSISKENNQAADLPRGTALTLLEQQNYLGSTALAGEFLDYVDQRAGLLLGRGGGGQHPAAYSFPHRTFQEYLAGCHILNERHLVRHLKRLAQEKDFWDNAVQIAFEELRFNRKDLKGLYDLAYHLCPHQTCPGEQQARLRYWSGKIARLCGIKEIQQDCEEPEGGETYLKRLMPALVQTLSSDLTALERSEVGNILAHLGDPRKSVITIEEMEFCLVPAGPFLMGSLETDDQAFDAEKLQHELNLDYNYWISRFPVTNAQFNEFVAAEGYANEEFWEVARKAGVWKNGVFQGNWDAHPRSRPVNWGLPFNLPNHPVTGITWYEAIAFIAWLNQKFQKENWLPDGGSVRLPSEAEWEKAARGGYQIPSPNVCKPARLIRQQCEYEMIDNEFKARIYPWGNSLDPDRLNFSDTNIGSTSTVGCFPSGASPYGCEEMSGNVWEWTRSLWGKEWETPKFKYPYQPEDGREELTAPIGSYRVLRGGSWPNGARNCRSAYRSSNSPGYRSSIIGFRLVFVP